ISSCFNTPDAAFDGCFIGAATPARGPPAAARRTRHRRTFPHPRTPPVTIALIDYGAGNLRSASKAFERMIAATGKTQAVEITSDPDTVARADRVVLPGDGA